MISSIRLQQFRSYKDSKFDFSPAVNIIIGPNASGKTNLLESILVTARGSSYRAKDVELIGFEAEWARIDAETDTGQRTIKLKGEPNLSKTYEFDEKLYKRLNLQHTLPIVLFEPNHLQLLHGAPDQRRIYLDDLLEQAVPQYGALRQHYRRSVAQRNALLKRLRKPNNEELFPWNLRLSELGATIARRRAELSESINKRLPNIYQQLSNAKTKTSLQYLPEFNLENYESLFLQKLESGLAVDLLRGFTAHGPHREDFVVLFDEHKADETASRGEVRTLVLALKVLELQLLQSARNMPPLLLLDDVFSELDTTRRQALTEELKHYQTFITTTDADVVIDKYAAKSSIISTTR